jgi:hypothetical protein
MRSIDVKHGASGEPSGLTSNPAKSNLSRRSLKAATIIR